MPGTVLIVLCVAGWIVVAAVAWVESAYLRQRLKIWHSHYDRLYADNSHLKRELLKLRAQCSCWAHRGEYADHDEESDEWPDETPPVEPLGTWLSRYRDQATHEEELRDDPEVRLLVGMKDADATKPKGVS